MNILVAGGAGYIGTHTCVSLLQSGHDVLVVDSLVNSRRDQLQRIQTITGKQAEFIEADIRDRPSLQRIFAGHRIDAVINFAGHKAVGESMQSPLGYYDNNLNCAIALLEAMTSHGVDCLVFSSSAAVYGEPESLPIAETARTAPQSPYGRTKLHIEEMLSDMARSNPDWKIALLRYFNPVGAHPGGLIGEQSSGPPMNLFPLVTRVAAGEQERLDVFGSDYDTRDGSAIRDYIHVMDLARGHVNALQALEARNEGGVLTVNLGTGKGYSVLEIIQSFESVCGLKIPYRCVKRRAGDMARCYADPALAKQLLGWQAEYGLEEMCRDAWNWQLRMNKPDRAG